MRNPSDWNAFVSCAATLMLEDPQQSVTAIAVNPELQKLGGGRTSKIASLFAMILAFLVMMFACPNLNAQGCSCTCEENPEDGGVYDFYDAVYTDVVKDSYEGEDGDGAYYYGSSEKGSFRSKAWLDAGVNESGFGAASISFSIPSTKTYGSVTRTYKYVNGVNPVGALFSIAYSGSGSVTADGHISGNIGSSSGSGTSQSSGLCYGQSCEGEPDLDYQIGIQDVKGECAYNTNGTFHLGLKIGIEETGIDAGVGSGTSGNGTYNSTNGWLANASREGCIGKGASIIVAKTTHQVIGSVSISGDGSAFWPAQGHAQVEAIAEVNFSIDNLRRCDD